MIFNMSITDNYASFMDMDSGISVFVDSFNNREFDVRIGNSNESHFAGRIVAKTDDELNTQLTELFLKYIKL